MASWGFFFPLPPHPPPYLHSLFGGTLGPVWIGSLLRSQAKDFSSARWHCHLGGTRRPSRSQDLTGPPRSLLILLLPPLPSLQRDPSSPGGSGGVSSLTSGPHLQKEGSLRGLARGVMCVDRQGGGLLGCRPWGRCLSRKSGPHPPLTPGAVVKLSGGGPVPRVGFGETHGGRALSKSAIRSVLMGRTSWME